MRIVICVCTYRRPEGLARLLEALTRIDRPEAELHLVVVDNACEPQTRALCEDALPRLRMRLRCVEEPRRGVTFARNRAVDEALALRADFLAFLDDDDVPDPDWLVALLRCQRVSGAELVFGTWRLAEEVQVPPRLAHLKYYRPHDYTKTNRFGIPAPAGTGNVLISGEFLARMAEREPVFDPSLAFVGGSDTDFFVRAVRAGARQHMCLDSVVRGYWSPDRATLRGILRRSHTHGYTGAFLDLKYGRVRRGRAVLRTLARIGKLCLRAIGGLADPTRRVDALFAIAKETGKLKCYLGRGHAYYGS